MRVTFHSWLVDTVGSEEADLALPDDVKTISDLATHLAQKYKSAESVFEVPDALRYVVDQRYVEPCHVLGDQVAVDIYPPITGG